MVGTGNGCPGPPYVPLRAATPCARVALPPPPSLPPSLFVCRDIAVRGPVECCGRWVGGGDQGWTRGPWTGSKTKIPSHEKTRLPHRLPTSLLKSQKFSNSVFF